MTATLTRCRLSTIASNAGKSTTATFMSAGNPHDTEPWEWQCGFYPGSRPGECTSGTAETLTEARANFEAAWKVFLANRTEADFQAWRDQEAWTAEKYRRFDRGERMPHDWRPGSA